MTWISWYFSGTLCASMLGYMFTDKGDIRAKRGFNNIKHMDINF